MDFVYKKYALEKNFVLWAKCPFILSILSGSFDNFVQIFW
jgi:hypothetical protein